MDRPELYGKRAPRRLSEKESTRAEDARRNALDILSNFREKKERLMEQEDEGLWPLMSSSGLITEDLVNNLTEILRSARFTKGKRLPAYYPLDGAEQNLLVNIIHLNKEFWRTNESLRPKLLIRKALILFYKGSQPGGLQTRPLKNIMTQFDKFMTHVGVYENGCFSCCGETSRFSMCEISVTTEQKRVVAWQKSGDSKSDLERTIQRTRHILTDALNKKHSLLVENPEELRQRGRLRCVPLISPRLVKTLIQALQTVEIKFGTPSERIRNNVSDRIDIHLQTRFWKEKDYLGRGSRPGSLILELSHALGYKYYGNSVLENSTGNPHNPHLCSSLSAYGICCAFEIWMTHQGCYNNGAYTCCGEQSRDSVCEASEMSQRLVI